MSLELGANYYASRAHWSADLQPKHHGRRGPALCSTEMNPVTVYDQEASDHGVQPQYRKLIADLPVCKKCARKVQAVGGDSGGSDA